MESSDKEQEKNKLNEVKTFSVPFALETFEESISVANTVNKQTSQEKLINQALEFHSKGNTLKAAKYYQDFINQGYKDHRVFSNFGVILKNNGKLQEAELSLRKAIELNPHFAKYHSNLGNILKNLGKLEEAEISLRKAIKLKPDSAEAHSNLGNILRDLSKLQEAELSTRKAIQLKPDLAVAHSNLGNILNDLDKFKQAEISYRKAIQLKPDLAIAHSNLGNILKNLGKLKEAEISLRKAIQLNPNFADTYSNLGSILNDLGKLEEAELSTRKAIELNPNFAEAHFNLGNILKNLGKLEQAESSQRKAIQLNPNFAEAHSNLGNILKNLGKLKEAEISQRKAIQLNPNFAEAHSNLGTILSDLGKLKEAELSTRKAIELSPNFADTHLNLGNILKDLGKLKEVIHLLKSTLALSSINQGDQLQASLQITITNLLQGDFKEALFNLNKTNKLIQQGSLNLINNNNNKQQALIYFLFISSLYPLLEKEKNNHNSERIPHIGESHCLSFAHQTLSIQSKTNKIQPVLITGGKAWHFANNKNNKWKDSLNQQIENHKYSHKAFISFGEIDCRKDEGILSYAIKNDKGISEVCEKTVKGFIDYMEIKLSTKYSKKYYFGVPAPTRKQESPDELDIKRIEMIKIYNSFFKKEVLSRGSYFLDVYGLTSNKNGENNNIHMCDETHLSPKCLSILFEKHLYES